MLMRCNGRKSVTYLFIRSILCGRTEKRKINKKNGRTWKQEMETGVMTDETKEDKQNKNHTWKWETETDATTDGKKCKNDG
jgi:hypothetical protein